MRGGTIGQKFLDPITISPLLRRRNLNLSVEKGLEERNKSLSGELLW